ncbi:hypothetical protein OROGR_029772 [Orobanche gracilis]
MGADDIDLHTLQLPVVSACGFDGPQTMKMVRSIVGNSVVVMIARSASHCFISHCIVAAIGLPIDDSVTLSLRLGDENQNTTACIYPD